MNVTIDDFHKLDLRMGRIEVAELVEGSEKLLRLEVEFGGEIGKRQILSGIAKFYTPEHLLGKTLPFITNLEPRKMMGLESQGMLVATSENEQPVLLVPDKTVSAGSSLR
jgi:methionine--tRNA ligase beta chain